MHSVGHGWGGIASLHLRTPNFRRSLDTWARVEELRLFVRAYLARSCPSALSQFSMWKVLAIVPSRIVWMSIAMMRKLFPVRGTPNRSPAGVPDLAAHDDAIARNQHF